MSLNRVMLIGNVGGVPEIRSTQEGKKIASFSVATNESWKDKNTGERRDQTEWHNVVIFNEKLVEIIERYVQKGTKLFVEGSLKTRKYTDKTGVERKTTEIVLQNFTGNVRILDSKNDGSTAGGDYSPPPASEESYSYSSSSSQIDDDIPF